MQNALPRGDNNRWVFLHPILGTLDLYAHHYVYCWRPQSISTTVVSNSKKRQVGTRASECAVLLLHQRPSIFEPNLGHPQILSQHYPWRDVIFTMGPPKRARNPYLGGESGRGEFLHELNGDDGEQKTFNELESKNKIPFLPFQTFLLKQKVKIGHWCDSTHSPFPWQLNSIQYLLKQGKRNK